MCTRANRASVPDSFHALVDSVVAVARAVLALFVALLGAPWRAVRSRPTKHGKPASTDRIEVQVHLEDGGRVRAIERSCRATLKRVARTWAPFALPLDRVEVISSAPPLGKADIFDQWVTTPTSGDAGNGTLVVISIGTSRDGRDLSADEIAGALVGQIERLVIDRYQREHPKAQPAPVAKEPVSQAAASPPVLVQVEASTDSAPRAENVTDISALIAGLKKSQPLVPAGSSKNGVHPEADPPKSPFWPRCSPISGDRLGHDRNTAASATTRSPGPRSRPALDRNSVTCSPARSRPLAPRGGFVSPQQQENQSCLPRVSASAALRPATQRTRRARQSARRTPCKPLRL